jgi:hypothetical protein
LRLNGAKLTRGFELLIQRRVGEDLCLDICE